MSTGVLVPDYFYADAVQPVSKLDAACSLADDICRGDDSPDAIKEAAAKAKMSVEDYLIQRKAATRGGLRDIQKREMAI
jgi:hypothetical protein